jgi:hypothetical protein
MSWQDDVRAELKRLGLSQRALARQGRVARQKQKPRRVVGA